MESRRNRNRKLKSMQREKSQDHYEELELLQNSIPKLITNRLRKKFKHTVI